MILRVMKKKKFLSNLTFIPSTPFAKWQKLQYGLVVEEKEEKSYREKKKNTVTDVKPWGNIINIRKFA